ncbi:MAG: phage portal protein [Chloroflexi bacterium]|jgi:HK97 family phage portal protein|nr:phage portal protein [Chloroflexota bacterium]
MAIRILERLGRSAQGDVRKNDMPLQPKWQRHFLSIFDNFESVVEDAYKKNTTASACMWVLQSTFPEPEMWAWERGDLNDYKPIQGHAYRKLMRQPNPDMGEVELYQYVITYAPLGGNVYLWKQRDQAERVKALFPFHDGQIRPIRGRSTADGLVAYYVLDLGDSEQYNPWKLDRFDDIPGVAIPKTEVIHWKWMVDPANPERGMGAFVASAGDVKIGNEIRDYIYSFLKNDATPPIAVTSVEGEEVTPEKATRWRKMWKERMGGENRGSPAFLQSGQTIQQLAWTLKDMEFSTLQDGPDTAICNAFHVHPAVVGTLAGLKNSTFTNMEEANKSLAMQTLVPLWRSFASEVQQGMAGEIGYAEDVVIRFDLSQVRALQESQTEIENRLGQMFDRGGITRAEYRKALGFDADDADNVYKENLASIWVPRGQIRQNDPELIAAEEERQNGDKVGRLKVEGTKTAERIGVALRRKRAALTGKMATQVDGYFDGLAARVVERASALEKSGGKQTVSTKALPVVTELVTAADDAELENLLKRWYVEVARLSWDTWNAALGVELVFDATDPLVTGLASMAGGRVVEITATTKEALRDTLAYGAENGWSIDQLVRGTDEMPGIRDVIEQTYKGRAENIARTELGTAQNTASVLRYQGAGVEQVMVLDDGFDNSNENCTWINGQVRPLAWTLDDHPAEGPSGIKNPLQHPNCVRCYAPYYE